MKTIFFINNAKKAQNEPNSIVLRFYIKSLKKYKVKGLAINCTKKDWNQEEQKIKRSNPEYKKFNSKLNFIEDELIKIEQKRDVTNEDIDTIVKASIKNIEVKDVINETENLKEILNIRYKEILNGEFSAATANNYKSAINKIKRFEDYYGKAIVNEDLINSIELLQVKILNWCRNVEINNDLTINRFFDKLNTSIKEYNKNYKKNIPVFNQKENKYKHAIKEKIYLNKEELSKLYKYVYNPSGEMLNLERPKPSDLNHLKYFLFRCLCGMRVSEMNSNNINPNKVNPFTKDLEPDSSLLNKDYNFNYYANKTNKKVSVPYIGTYLYDIASDLDWEFPDLSKHKNLVYYVQKEGKLVGEALERIYGNRIRMIETVDKKQYSYKKLSDSITTHTARKTFAYLIYNINRDIVQVMYCLGHSKIETTMLYLGLEYDTKSIESFRLNL